MSYQEKIEALVAERAALREQLAAVSDALDYLHGMTPQQASALRKDAERYRWLRAQCDTTTNLVQYRRGNALNIIPCHSAGDMDFSIDAAMAAAAAVGAA